MKKIVFLKSIFAAGILLAGFFLLQSGKPAEDLTISITVSPSVLNLQNNGQVVTVHTTIAYSAVVGSEVTLNGIPISWWKADNKGNFVAKFLIDDIKNLEGLMIGEENELTLTGITNYGDTFSGTDWIMVVNNIPKK